MADEPAVVETTNAPPAPAAVVPPAAVTPPAPVATPAPLPVVQTPAIPEGAADDGAVAYDPTGDAGLDVALNFIGGLGLAGDHPAVAAAAKGDFGLLKATLATMGDKARGWEQMVALGEDAYKRNTEKAAAQATAVQNVVHGIAGGEDQWKTVQTWARDNATPEEKAEINTLFDSGVMGARAAAKLLVDAYRSATGTVVNPASATKSAASGAAIASNGPLSSTEYAAAVRDLHAKLGNRMDASPEYAALRARLRR